MRLEELQRAFQDHVLHEGGTITNVINASARFSAANRMGVYSDAYRLRLTEALAHNYPHLERYLGEEAFAQLARRYISRYPSNHFSVRWFGDRLVDLLENEPPYNDRPWLADLARWEWAVAAAFDAPDATPVRIEALSEIDANDWPDLRFQFHPSMLMLPLQTNAPTVAQARESDTNCPIPAIMHAPQIWLIWRQDFTARFRQLNDDEAEALETMSGAAVPETQGTFEEMCDVLCRHHDTDDVPLIAAGMLKTWATQELITAILLR